MAEGINALILPIGADATQFQKSINDVKDRIKELSATIKATPFNFVTQGQRDELAGLISTLDKLNDSVATTSNTFDKSNEATKRSRTALTSLSLVAQDLPFGFIAIQNNLPALIQQFGLLKQEAGGLKGALSQIGSALIGPAGIFLAFSAVTAGITLAVQKYGSLEAAISSFAGKTLTAADAQNKLSKALEDTNKANKGEIANLQSLISIATSVNSTRQQQIGAQDELNKSYPALLANIKTENLTTAESIALIAARTRLITNQIVLEGRRQALIKLLGESFVEGEKALSAFTNRDKLGFFDKLGLELRGLFAGIGGLGVINVLNQDLGNAASQTSTYSDELKRVNGELTQTNGEVNQILDTIKKGSSTKIEGPKVDKDWERFLELTRQSNLRLAEFYANQLKIQADKNLAQKLKEDAAAYKELEAATLGAKEANAQFGIGLQNSIQNIDTTYANAIIETGGILQRFKDAQMSGANEFARIQEQIKNFEGLQSTIENNLTKPFREFFDELLTNGKVSFDGFVQLAKDAFKRILAQAIASGIANLIASLLSGGATAGLGKLGAAKGISAILGNLGKTGGLFGSANFSGVQGGAMQMAGAVNLTLRGSDLVASINRTNSTINRIG